MEYNSHDYILNRIAHDVSTIAETKHPLWIMQDGFYFPNHTQDQGKLCDLIIGYDDHTLSLVELKRDECRLKKAIQQLLSGYELTKAAFPQYELLNAKVVFYGQNNLRYKNIDLEKCIQIMTN